MDPTTDTVYVTNMNSNTVSVIDGATNQVTDTVGVGAGPVGVAVDPLTHAAYVTNGNANTVSVITPATGSVPAAPAHLTASASNGSASLSWTAPSSDGGSAITGYDVFEGTSSGTESSTPVNSSPLPASATSYTVSGLTNGTTYDFTVEAVNSVGHSPASNQASATPAAPTAPQVPVWMPPTLTPESVTVDGVKSQVIGNLGYNPAPAIQGGTFAGYVEERAAIEAGATFSREGTDSSYLSAILDGSGVGINDAHVTPEQQGQFAALYQKLGIIPTWTDNTVSLPQGVTTLLQSGASTLAIENYLVQLDGFSWAAAQAASGFRMQSGT